MMKTAIMVTYQDTARRGLSRNEFSRPILGFRHERPFELLLALPRSLLFLLLGIVGSILRFLPAAQKRERSPYQHDQQSSEERADAGQQEAPILADHEAILAEGGAVGDVGRLARRLFARHTDETASGGRGIHSGLLAASPPRESHRGNTVSTALGPTREDCHGPSAGTTHRAAGINNAPRGGERAPPAMSGVAN